MSGFTAEQLQVLELTRLAGLNIREDVFAIVSRTPIRGGASLSPSCANLPILHLAASSHFGTIIELVDFTAVDALVQAFWLANARLTPLMI